MTLGLRFIDAFEETIQSLTVMPKGASCEFDNPRYLDLHCWPVNGFPNHLIFYRLTGQRIEVVRVLHGARDFGKLFG